MSDSVWPKQIVQIPRNALALGHLGQVLDFIVGTAQFLRRAVHLRPEMVSHSHQNDEHQHRAPKTERQLQMVGVQPQQDQIDPDEKKRSQQTGSKGAGRNRKNHEAADRTIMEGNQRRRHNKHRDDGIRPERLAAGERVQIQPDKHESVDGVANPQQRSGMFPQRVKEEPDHEGQP